MSTTVSYKGNTIATVNNSTKVLETGGTWLEDDLTLVDVTSGGDSPVINSLSVTENGTYTAPSGVDGYSPVTVNVSGGGGIDVDDIATNTEPSGAISLTITEIKQRAFAQKPITSVNGSNVTKIYQSAFENCASLASVSFPSLTNIYSSGAFAGCTALQMLVFPSLQATQSNAIINGCGNLTTIDIGGDFSTINATVFSQANKFKTLILRRTSGVVSLGNTSAFNNTAFSGYNSQTGTVYVPSALISSYKIASNWVTLFNNGTISFVAIEESPYKNAYADGTPIAV